MRIGIVVDSACDVPTEFIERENVTILPVTVQIGQAVLADHRDEQATLNFLHDHVAKHGIDAETTPFTVQQVHDLFLSELVLDYDYVFCITTTRTRSGIHDNAQQASYTILNDYKPVRQAAGNNTPFSLRVIDSQNVFAAVGVLAIEAARLREAGEAPPKIRERLEELALNTHGYMVPPDLYYLRNRARTKGDRSVSLFSAALGTALDIKPILHCHRGETAPAGKIKGFETAVQKLFDFTVQRIHAGLMTPTLCVSYGGELAELRALPGYARLRETCAANSIELFESVMSLTGMVNVGKGAIVLGFAAPPHTFA